MQTAPNLRIRARSAAALGKLRWAEAIPILCQVADQDPDLQVRLMAIDALVLIANPKLLTLMSDVPKNQPTFHINTVGNLNTGDVTIQGDQIGIQHNYAPEPQETEAAKQLILLLSKLRTQYPNATDSELFDILTTGFETMPQQNPQNWHRWQDVFSVIFVGGVEATKILVPVAGIPIEVLKRLYEIYQRHPKQLPNS